MNAKMSDIERIPMSVLVAQTAEDTGHTATEIHLIVKQLIANLTEHVIDGYAVNLDSLATIYPDVIYYGEPTVTAKINVSKVLTRKCRDTKIKYKQNNPEYEGFDDITL